jgi:hypothetical protein
MPLTPARGPERVEVTLPADRSEIVPDVRDWTFVIAEGCAECGFDPRSVDPAGIGARLRGTVDRWAAVLDRPAAPVRPDPQTWSPLEYGCHVRDAAEIFLERLRLMLTHDDAQFSNWDQDRSAIDGRYGEQVGSAVAFEYAGAASATADLFDGVAPGQWQRRGRRSNGSTFTVETLGVYLLHDIEHHLHDVAR